MVLSLSVCVCVCMCAGFFFHFISFAVFYFILFLLLLFPFQDHELVRRTNLNTLSPLYNKRQLKFFPTKYHNDFHQATIATSHRTSENEKEFWRISKNNLLLAKLFEIGNNVDWTGLENVIKFVLYCLLNPILFDDASSGARISFVDRRTFNKIDIVSEERYPLVDDNGQPNVNYYWSLLVIDNFIIRLIHIVNGDQNFVRVFTSDNSNNICARFSKCKLIVSSFVYNCVNNVCDTFSTKWLNCFDSNRSPPSYGIDDFLNNHKRCAANRTRKRTKSKPIACVNKLKNLLQIVDIFHFRSDHKVFQSNELANNNNSEHNLSPTQTNLKVHNNNSVESKCRLTKSSIEWHRQLKHKSCPLSSSLESCVGNRQRFSNGAILSKTNSFGSSVLKHHFLLMFFILITCTPIISASLHNIKYSTNTVKTKYGLLRGIMVRTNPSVEAFLGVPYATPPVGSLR